MSTSYEVSGPTPDVVPLPVRSRGHITFGSFNKANKLNSAVIATWARVLDAVPTARLLLKFRGLGDPVTIAQFRARFALYGVDPSRIDFEGHSPFQEMYERYTTVDIGLDPFPYTGGTTTILASWMGVPIVTWPDETLSSRQSFAVLQGLGITETIAGNLDEYVKIAVELARDWDRLEALRLKLRPAYQQSALANGGIVANALATALRDVWRQWCSIH
jgi:predicted O-linked N-acetylglucosamine transferase (SPINDLY family)